MVNRTTRSFSRCLVRAGQKKGGEDGGVPAGFFLNAHHEEKKKKKKGGPDQNRIRLQVLGPRSVL